MDVVKLLIFVLQLTGVKSNTHHCLNYEFNRTHLRLTFRTSNFGIPVVFNDPKGANKGYCDFNRNCEGITYNTTSNEVVLDIPDVKLLDVQGTWFSSQGSKRYMTNVSITGDILSSTALMINGSKLEYSSVPYVEITCWSCREPYFNSVEFYVNHRSGKTLTYQKDSKMCFIHNNKCTPGLCSCSASGSTFTYVYSIHNNSTMNFSCVMQFKGAKQTFRKISNLHYDGKDSFKFLGSRTIIEVDKTGDDNDKDNHPEQKQNEGIKWWMIVIIASASSIFLTIICLCCKTLVVRRKIKKKGNAKRKSSELKPLLHSPGPYHNDDDQMRRYLVTKYLLIKYISPVLREYVKNGMEILYMFWKSKVKLHNQSCLSHVITYKPKNLKLNYSAINQNSRKIVKLRNYNVRNVVDFSKLFLPSSLARYDDFGRTIDIESLVELITTVEEFDLSVKKHAIELKDIVMKVCNQDPFHNENDFHKTLQTMKECFTFFTSEKGDVSSTTRKGFLSPKIVTNTDDEMFDKWVNYGMSAISNECLTKVRNALDQQKSPWQPPTKYSAKGPIEEEDQPQVESKSIEQEMDKLEEILSVLLREDDARTWYRSLFEKYKALKNEFLSLYHERIISWNEQRRIDFFEDLHITICDFKRDIKSLAEKHMVILGQNMSEIRKLVSDLEKEMELLLGILEGIKNMTRLAVEMIAFCQNKIDVSTLTIATRLEKLYELQARRVDQNRLHTMIVVIESVTHDWERISNSTHNQLTLIEEVLTYQQMKGVHLTKLVNLSTREVQFVGEPFTNLQLEIKKPVTEVQKGTGQSFLSEERDNYIRLFILITGDAYNAVRTYFDKLFPPDSLFAIMQKHKNSLNLLKRKGLIQQRQWDLIFPEKGFPKSNDFDFALMMLLVKHVSSVVYPYMGVDKYPSAKDLSPCADLERIRHYRNHMAHLPAVSVGNQQFDEILKELKSAIGRLGGPTLEKEVERFEEIRNADNIQFDENEMKEMYWDLEKNYKKQLRGYAELFREYVNETNEDVCSKFVEMYGEVDMQSDCGKLPKSWTPEDEFFIQTHAAEKLLNMIKDGSVRHVAVTGESGVGKSFTLKHIAFRLKKNGFETLNIKNSSTIVRNELLKLKANRPLNKRLYVIDDFCGVNMTRISEVKALLSAVEFVKMFTDNEVVVCIICPLDVYDDKALVSIRNNFTEFDMSSGDLQLSKTEKTTFAKHLLRLDTKMIPEAFYSCKNVPLICKLYQRDPLLNIKDLSENYHSVYEKGVDAMLDRENYNGYYALALCVLFNNELEEQLFIRKDKRINKLIDAVSDTLELPDDVFNPRDILQQLASLPILQSFNGVYRTIHDTIFDLLCVYFSRQIIGCIIENASSDFLMERTCLVSNDKHKANLSVIYVQGEYHDSYRERITRDWLDGKLEQVFGSVNMKYPTFRVSFLSYVKKLDLIKQHDLKHATDDKTDKSAIFYFRQLKDDDFIYWFLSAEDKDDPLSKSEKLYLSCREGDTDAVRSLVETQGLTRCPAYKYLFIACQRGHKEIVYILLNENADPNEKIENGTSSLYAACHGGHTDIVRALLLRNADVNINKSSNLSPLYTACKNGYFDIVQALLQNNAQTIVFTKNRMTLLHIACDKGEFEIVKLLLEKNQHRQTSYNGAVVAQETKQMEIKEANEKCITGINSETNNGITPLFLACLHNHVEITKLLIKYGADPNIGKKEEENIITPLFIAVQQEHIKIVEELLVAKTDINKCSYNITPLFIACENNLCDIVKLLLQKKANVGKTYIGFAPIHIACTKGHTEIVRMLLEYKCKDNIELCNKYGQSPLYIACFYGHLSTAQLLLKCKSRLSKEEADEQRDPVGLISPLGISCFRGHVDIVKTLLTEEHSCKLKTPSDQWSVSPLYLATVGNRRDVVEILIENKDDFGLKYGDSGETCLHKACELGFLDLVDFFIEKGVDINLQTKREATALYIAAENGHKDIVKMLITRGADANHRTKLGFTPLDIACENNDIELATVLVEHMDDANHVRNEKSEEKELDRKEAFNYPTPLHIACSMNCPEIVDVLLNKGAKTDITLNKSGASPLFIACQRGNFEIVEKILQHNMLKINGIKAELEKTIDAKEKEGLEISLEINEMIINQITDTGETPLHIACETGCLKIVCILLQYNADLNSYPSDKGMLPLHIACQKGFLDIGYVLLNRRAAVNEQTESGATPIFIASQYGATDMVTLLLCWNADTKLNNYYGISPIQVAEKNGFPQIALLLKDN